MMQGSNDPVSQHPVSVNEILDLFEAFALSIDAPLTKAVNLIHDQLGYQESDIFANIVGVVDSAETMAKRLKAIRVAFNSDRDVSISLSDAECLCLGNSFPAVFGVIDDISDSLDILIHGFEMENFDPDHPGIAASLRLFRRSLQEVGATEIQQLVKLDQKIRASVAWKGKAALMKEGKQP